MPFPRQLLIVALGLAACGPVSVTDDATPRLSEAAFESLRDALARRADATVGATGEARLGDDGALHRWARLDPDDPGRARGGYVLEDGLRAWLITYETNGRTEAWAPGPGASAIEHVQAHHHGSETVVFALRGGEPAVLSYELVDEDFPEENVRRTYARDGKCIKTCPPLRGFDTQDARFTVSGPGATVEALTMPPR